MQYFELVLIGLVTGLFGGLLGIGGSVVMIPALALVFGENQHLYQASAMICNFFIASASLIAHKKAKTLVKDVLIRMVPLAMAGIILGVTASNAAIFAGENSYILARIFGAFLVWVVAFNGYKLIKSIKNPEDNTQENNTDTEITPGKKKLSMLIGLIVGFGSGLLGIGAGVIAVPLQQLILKLPIKKAMSNSSATITMIALIGATYKTATLAKHGVVFDFFPNDIPAVMAMKIAAVIIPTAILGALLGGYLMHRLPRNVVRTAFILLAALASYKLLTA